MYQVEISQSFKADQGLKSPVRADEGLKPLAGGATFDVILRAGIEFREDQLTARGWFVDTDAVERQVATVAAYLSGAAWTEQFEFRPTFELVGKWAYENYAKKFPSSPILSSKT